MTNNTVATAPKGSTVEQATPLSARQIDRDVRGAASKWDMSGEAFSLRLAEAFDAKIWLAKDKAGKFLVTRKELADGTTDKWVDTGEGFATFNAYVTDVMGKQLRFLNHTAAAPVSRLLKSKGFSVREISAATGRSVGSTFNDIKERKSTKKSVKAPKGTATKPAAKGTDTGNGQTSLVVLATHAVDAVRAKLDSDKKAPFAERELADLQKAMAKLDKFITIELAALKASVDAHPAGKDASKEAAA
jgi:hypothetical protein